MSATANPSPLAARILRANETFVASNAPRREAPAGGGPPLVLVTCQDPRLTLVLEAALGLAPGASVLIRNSGNTIAPGCRDLERSVAVAILRLGAA
ncbi:MAG: hypothetical protein AAB215_04450, partial [Planctomycetota bacterium]